MNTKRNRLTVDNQRDFISLNASLRLMNNYHIKQLSLIIDYEPRLIISASVMLSSFV